MLGRLLRDAASAPPTSPAERSRAWLFRAGRGARPELSPTSSSQAKHALVLPCCSPAPWRCVVSVRGRAPSAAARVRARPCGLRHDGNNPFCCRKRTLTKEAPLRGMPPCPAQATPPPRRRTRRCAPRCATAWGRQRKGHVRCGTGVLLRAAPSMTPQNAPGGAARVSAAQAPATAAISRRARLPRTPAPHRGVRVGRCSCCVRTQHHHARDLSWRLRMRVR
jgi:hypothetical protein